MRREDFRRSFPAFFVLLRVTTVKKVLSLICTSAVLGLSLAAGAAGAADLKIGVVNMERILRDSQSAAQASERLNAEGPRRQEEIDAVTKRFKQRLERFEKEAPAMAETERLAERRELA